MPAISDLTIGQRRALAVLLPSRQPVPGWRIAAQCRRPVRAVLPVLESLRRAGLVARLGYPHDGYRWLLHADLHSPLTGSTHGKDH